MKIGVAGSMQFTEKQMEICGQLRARGHEVFMSREGPLYVGKTDNEKEKIKLDEKYNRNAMHDYWDQLKTADAIVVANYDKHGIKNYIGGNAFLDMGIAHMLGQKIYLINPIPDMPYYGTEIIAMRPIVLNGDVSNIK